MRRFLFPFTFLLLISAAGAHPQLLIAEFSSEPAVPPTGEEFEITVQLNETSGQAAPGLDMRLWIYPQGVERAAIVEEEIEPRYDVPLAGVADSGTYRGTVPALEEGGHPIRLVELIRETVESNAAGTLEVGEDVLDLELLLPPVAAGLGTWLVWLVGLPLVAGVLVTILILTGKGKQEQE